MPDPNLNKASLGAWNKKVALDHLKADALNRDPLDVTKDQIRQLYSILYPFIAADFVHRTANARFEAKVLDEMKKAVDAFNRGLKQWVSTQLNTHQHIGNNGAPVSPPSAIKPIQNMAELDVWSSLPENGKFTDGEDHIVDANKKVPSKNIRHRDNKANDKVNTRYKITDLLSGGDILTPFDVDDDSALSNNETFGETL